MKKISFWVLLMILMVQYSCITDKDKYQETDLFEEYESQKGFTILHLPPIVFKIILSASDDSVMNSKELLDKIDLLKVMFFEEKENTIKNSDLKASINTKITESDYVLLTRIAQVDNDISIYVIEKEQLVHEILITMVSQSEYIGLNIIGKLSKDEIMDVYKTVNMQNLQKYKN